MNALLFNPNPIQYKKEAIETVFKIPEHLKEKILKLSVEYILDKDGWLYGGTTDVLLNGDFIFSSDSKTPKELEIGMINAVNNSDLKVYSELFLINNTGETQDPPSLQTKIYLYADEELIDKFEMASNSDLTFNFNSWMHIQII